MRFKKTRFHFYFNEFAYFRGIYLSHVSMYGFKHPQLVPISRNVFFISSPKIRVMRGPRNIEDVHATHRSACAWLSVRTYISKKVIKYY